MFGKDVGEGLERLVPRLVSVDVIDGLEVVEIEDDHRQRATSLSLSEGLVQKRAQECAIG